MSVDKITLKLIFVALVALSCCCGKGIIWGENPRVPFPDPFLLTHPEFFEKSYNISFSTEEQGKLHELLTKLHGSTEVRKAALLTLKRY